MISHSILFTKIEDIQQVTFEAPDFFADLNLDQIIDAITATKEEYTLKPFFYTSLKNINDIEYRQEIMQDLEEKTLLENLKYFSQQMSAMRRTLGMIEKLYYKYHKEGWFLEAVTIYCDAITGLAHNLSQANLRSKGLSAFRGYLLSYISSEKFTSLLSETEKMKAGLSAVRYSVLINGRQVKVSKYEQETDYSVEVEKTFEKFKQGTVKDYRIAFPDGLGMNHIEAEILDLVARLHPDIFLSLDDYRSKVADYLDETIVAFDREIQFYIAYLEYIAKVKEAGLTFCYPQVIDKSKEIYDYEGFDIALAHKLIAEKSSVVCNDFYLKNPERILVVSGPNQGGKTTFARMFGQLHYLASLGLSIPGRNAKLFLFETLFTHFEKEENIQNLRGKLKDDLIRIYHILNTATPDSIIILNEIFTSTTLKDALFLSDKVMEKIIQLDSLCVWVTFIDELASRSEKTVSMISTVVPENPAERTYKIVRRKAEGLAYATAIAEKYRLTYDQLRERLNHEGFSDA